MDDGDGVASTKPSFYHRQSELRWARDKHLTITDNIVRFYPSAKIYLKV